MAGPLPGDRSADYGYHHAAHEWGELAQRVAKSRPELPILFVSGYSGNTILHEIVPRGAIFLQKPFNHETLMRKVREALDHGKD